MDISEKPAWEEFRALKGLGGPPKSAALQMVRAWDSIGPRLDLRALCEWLGVAVQFTDLGKLLSVLSFEGYERPGILVSQCLTMVQQRFAIAHQIGHLILHRVPQKFSCGYLACDPSAKAGLETEASEFARHLLVPWDMLASELRYAKSELDLGSLLRIFGTPVQVLTEQYRSSLH